MIRRTLNIGYYQYVLDLFSPEEDNISFVKKEFLMLRKFTFINNIISDTDIFIIDKDTWQEMCVDLDSQNDNYFPITTHIAFPNKNRNMNGYNNSPMEFNSNFTKDSLYKKNYREFEYGKDVYPLTDKDGNPKEITCNLLKLYHPNNKLKLDGIICIENYINNIHFYYLCKPLNNYKYNSDTEFIVNNHIYSEYLEIYFPNINELFKSLGNDVYNLYYNENINNVVSIKNEAFLNRMIISDKGLEKYEKFSKDEKNNIIIKDQYVPLNLLLQPFQIVEDIDPKTVQIIEEEDEETGEKRKVIDHKTLEKYNVKVYLKNHTSLESNYITNPFTISIYPYSEISKENNNYVLDENLSTANVTYSVEYKFSLLSKLGFDQSHKISLISTFNYPYKEKYLEEYNGNTSEALKSAYKYFYEINEDNYKYYWVNKLRIDFPEKEEKLLEEYDKLYDNSEEEGEISNEEKLLTLIKDNYNGIYDDLRDWEIEEEFETGMDFIGFRIQIATDSKYRNLVFNQTYSIDLDQLDDFSFNIDNVFVNWDEMPDFLIGRTIFIDRILNKILVSNSVVISKEAFKYIINNQGIYNINILNKENCIMKEKKFNNDINGILENYKGQLNNVKDNFYNSLNNEGFEYLRTEVNEKFKIEKEQVLSYIGEIKSHFGVNDIQSNIGNYNILDYLEKHLDNIKCIDRYLGVVKPIIERRKTNLNNQINNISEINIDNIVPFNFVNNINCIVEKPQNELKDVEVNKQQKIIFKPIFFKTQDLQNIRLRSGVTQNIGINLVNYMTKVETFKLVIEGIEFIENSRNDIYVIFNINSNLFVTSSGKYNIVTQDDEYVSSGNWVLY